ncbi:hypothetical protein [Nocardioides donggukensis]|uniref:Uncharacterized protein n=1 Tax=Nocardioides donggukensis TaxID=2774019 RepID=A0A927Q0S1_9ACTN|nr:hypothetical protein [Nocardioides donggukensis]MBD8868066.1 hypothetical protein [Nocardioides donggukensis]
MRATVALLVAALVLAGCSGQDGDGDRDGDRGGPDAGSDWSPAPVDRGGLTVLAESDGDGFRLHTSSGTKTFLPGVNLGSTTPLHQPGEVGTIEAETYRRWLEGMAETGIRAVRVYTLHPPAFYTELERWNEEHPQAPIYLVQGAYLPDESYVEAGRTLYDPAVDEAFSAELADLSDAVHGDLSRPERPGRAGGDYDADVSQWVAAWILGVEWEPPAVLRTDRAEADAPYEPGEFFAATDDATATERWIATHLDELAAYEADRGTSAPVALANWPTADPLDHPTEPSPYEDLVGVDAMHVLPTDAWPGGTFASFHAYPYYPDFQRDEPGLDETTWQGEPDRYAGYLASLQEHFAGTMPLLVTEFGVPASLGSAHLAPAGRDQGDHTEQEAMAMNADMLRMMADLGVGGGFVFEWTDEWFKRTWNTVQHQVGERRQLWHDPLTNEQYFGIVATDPEPVADAATEISPEGGPIEYALVWADASWVHLEVTFRDGVPQTLDIGADVLPGPQREDYRVRIDAAAGTARAEVRRALDPIRLDTLTRPYHPEAGEDWHLFRLLTNRSTTGPQGERPAEYLDVGDLVEGTWDPEDPDYDSLATWQVLEDDDRVEVRVPWSMLGFADPSSRTALGEGDPAELVTVDGIDFEVAADGVGEAIDFTWPEWNFTGYVERRKAGADVLAEAFRDLAP